MVTIEETMDEVSDTVMLALNNKYPEGANSGAISVTLASLSVILMAENNNCTIDEAKVRVSDFIKKAPLDSVKTIPLNTKDIGT